jgi:LPXTG-motif cell wall-anchored protein
MFRRSLVAAIAGVLALSLFSGMSLAMPRQEPAALPLALTQTAEPPTPAPTNTPVPPSNTPVPPEPPTFTPLPPVEEQDDPTNTPVPPTADVPGLTATVLVSTEVAETAVAETAIVAGTPTPSPTPAPGEPASSQPPRALPKTGDPISSTLVLWLGLAMILVGLGGYIRRNSKVRARRPSR